MPKEIAVWLLNRVSTWDPRPIVQALEGGLFGRGKNTVRLGQRGTLSPGVLMYEGSDTDEYFVPIPVKCLGDPSGWTAGPVRERLQRVLDCYPQHFSPGGKFPWDYFWKPNPKGVFSDLTMVGPVGEGYYQVLQDYSRAHPGCRHVLVGYSQGGLVARFLAYLDEVVFEGELIEGIVTIESPNFGSPVARNANADHVAQSLSLVLAGLGQMSEASFPQATALLRSLAQTPQNLDIGWILDFLDAALGPFGSPRARTALFQTQHGMFDFLSSARKWLSGLDDRPTSRLFDRQESAFFDLDLSQLSVPGSVLECTTAHPLQRIQHAAIVGADRHLDDLVGAMVSEFATSKGWVGRVIYRLFRRHVRQFLHEKLKIAGHAYAGALEEQTLPPAPHPLLDRVRLFEEGVSAHDRTHKMRNGGLGPRAHDFVIPSVYQLIESDSPAFLGNWVNPRATHLSGADTRLAGGLSLRWLVGILQRMR